MSGSPACPIIAVGGSAGGVEALRGFAACLPVDLAAAVLVVVHHPATGRSQLDQVLQTVTRLPVTIGIDGEHPLAGHIYVSTPDWHMILNDGVLRLTSGPPECHVRPAVDVLFRSVAVALGPRAAGIVLSGMLDDGTAGLWAIKEHGGMAFVQDPGEAMHASMPTSAIQHVQVDGVHPVHVIAERVIAWAARVSGPGVPPGRPVQPLHRLETEIAGGRSTAARQLFELAAPSPFTCPECQGVLAEIREGSIIRFRCHNGHAYSRAVLLQHLDDGGRASWAT